MADDEKIKLQSGDNEVFEVTRDVACVAVTIKEVLEDTESDTAIPLPNLWSKVSTDQVRGCVATVLQASKDKRRNFTETVEMQLRVKDYDAGKDKRFNGSIKLPHNPRPRMKICVIGDAKHCEEADGLNLDFKDVEGLKTFNKNKKLIKKWAKKYHAFMASESLIKQIPRLLGPGLNKAGKFPTLVKKNTSLADAVEVLACTVKFQLKKVMGLACAVGHVGMSETEITQNIMLALNFFVSLLKKGWQNCGACYIKSTMGPSQRLY